MTNPFYISATGLENIKEELAERKMVLRKQIAQDIGDAKELGDLSENFEYHDAKERQAQNENKIMLLENQIKNVVIVDEKSGGDTVQIGCTFVAETGDKTKEFTIVGSNEADPLSGKISNESPLGQAFLGNGVGDSVDIEVPSGIITYKITSIK